MRKQKWAALPRNSNPMPQGFYTNGHRHGCRVCHAVIPTCSCDTPQDDPLCEMCLLGRERMWWPSAWDPRDCCRYHSTLVQTEERNQFLLAGLDRRWHGCRECGRHHPFDPSSATSPPSTLVEWEARFGSRPVVPQTSTEFGPYIRERNATWQPSKARTSPSPS